MTAIKTTFDGKSIAVPDELRGAAPGEVIIIYNDRKPGAGTASSVWDVVGKGTPSLSAEECTRMIRDERDSWGER